METQKTVKISKLSKKTVKKLSSEAISKKPESDNNFHCSNENSNLTSATVCHFNKAGEITPGFSPKVFISIKGQPIPHRGIKLLDQDNKHIKTVSWQQHSNLNYSVFFLFHDGKRLNIDELNFCIYQKYLIKLSKAYNNKMLIETIPDEIYKEIVKTRDDGIVYFTISFVFNVNNKPRTYTIKITKPEFKKLQLPARLNNRFLADNFKHITQDHINKLLKLS